MNNPFDEFINSLGVECGVGCEQIHPIISKIADRWSNNIKLDEEVLDEVEQQVSICATTETLIRTIGEENASVLELLGGVVSTMMIMAVRLSLMTLKEMENGK